MVGPCYATSARRASKVTTRRATFNPISIAPEVLDMPWDVKADIWCVGMLIWDLFENGNLFKTVGGPENKPDNIYHLGHMIAVLGPPPKDVLERTETDRPWGWFHKDEKWKDIANTSLEDAERKLTGVDKELFLHFVRQMLKR